MPQDTPLSPPPADPVTDAASDTPPRRRRRKEARPQELTAAALALFVEKGFAATKLDEIAARAGVSKGTLYLYFDSKEALFKAVIREGVVPAIAEAETLLEIHANDPRALIEGLVRGWWERIGNTSLGGIPKLMTSEARNFPTVAAYYHEAVIQRGLALLRAAVERGIALGVFRPVDLDLIGNLIISPVLHLSLWKHSFGPCCAQDMDPERFLRAAIDLLIHGLVVRPAPGDPA